LVEDWKVEGFLVGGVQDALEVFRDFDFVCGNEVEPLLVLGLQSGKFEGQVHAGQQRHLVVAN